MKAIYKYTLLLACASWFLQACKNENAEYSTLRNRAYIAQSATKANSLTTVNVSSDNPAGHSTGINVRLSDIQKEDNKFMLRPFSAEELEAYNKANGTSYVALPESGYRLPTSEVSVKAGSAVSEDVPVTILPLSDEEIRSGNKYVLPLKLTRVSGSAVISGGDEFLYVVKPTIITHVPVLGTDPGSSNVWFRAFSEANDASKEITTSQWTIEMRVNMTGFRMNNQAIFSSGGVSPEVYARFGDANAPYNYINIKVAGSQIDQSNTRFEANRWYHVAFVYNGTTLAIYVDGNKDIDTDKMSGKTFTFKGGYSIGSAHQKWRDAIMVSEYRVWSVARTPAQLKEYEYGVSPTSEGLVEYWKMDEASGREFKNSVAGGKSMFVINAQTNAEVTPRWLDNVRSDGAGRTRSN